MSISIRGATLQDATAIAHVHVASWRTTYDGLLPERVLAALSVAARTRQWKQWLDAREHAVFVAERADGRVVGFASGGPNRNRHPEFSGELSAIYLLDTFQRRGIGRRLTQAIVAYLQAQEVNSMLIWVLAGNAPARAFYSKLGGELVGAKTILIAGQHRREVAYGWRDLQAAFA